MNEIKTWQQGERASGDEIHLVRPSATENAICRCENQGDAKWIASRLNLASILEQMAYDYSTGKSDGQEIIDLVKNAVG